MNKENRGKLKSEGQIHDIDSKPSFAFDYKRKLRNVCQCFTCKSASTTEHLLLRSWVWALNSFKQRFCSWFSNTLDNRKAATRRN